MVLPRRDMETFQLEFEIKSLISFIIQSMDLYCYGMFDAELIVYEPLQLGVYEYLI